MAPLFSATISLLIGIAAASPSLGAIPRDIDNCPGVLYVASSDSSACCVGGTIQPLTLSDCDGWPVCQGPVTVTQTSEPLSCATVIPVTDSNYDSLISSASASLKNSGTHYQTTLAGGASMTGTPPSASAGSSITSPPSSASATGSAAGSSPSTGGSAQLVFDSGLVFALASLMAGAWLW